MVNTKRTLIDWKHWQTLSVGLLAIFVAVILWYLDANGKSITLTLVSKTSLQSIENNLIKGMEVYLNGVPVKNTYVSVIEISNDGRKPVLASDFELPIEFRISPETKIISAHNRISGPKEIEANFKFDSQTISVSPLLLNPGDKVTFSVITTGASPEFGAKSRIAGIVSPHLIDGTQPDSKTRVNWFYVLVAFLLLICMSTVKGLEALLNRKSEVVIRPRAALFVQIVCYFVSITFAIEAHGYLRLSSLLDAVPLFVIGYILASFVSGRLNRPLADSGRIGNDQTIIPISTGPLGVKPDEVTADNAPVESTDVSVPHPLSRHLSSPGAIRNYLTNEEKLYPILELDREKLRARFYGCKVKWFLQVHSIDTIDSVSVKLSAAAPTEFAWAETEPISVQNNPNLKLLKKGSDIVLTGTIVSIQAPCNVVLKDARVSIHIATETEHGSK